MRRLSKMEKCKTCINSRPIISENGIHWSCCLYSKHIEMCVTEVKDHYIAIVRNVNDDETS